MIPFIISHFFNLCPIRFFIGAEILMGLGVVRFMGTLFQPLMKPLFNVPGSGSFVMAVGLASGFPLGSILTARMRRENLCTKTEAERLICFTNTADPLFMFGAVAVGILHYPYLGTLIAVAHYLSSFSVGLMMRFYKKNNNDITPEERRKENIVISAFKSMFEARKKDGRPFGQLMGDAIKNSINTLLLIGGFIVLFSVIINILNTIGFNKFITSILSLILSPLGIGVQPDIVTAFLSGFFEVSLGCEKIGTLQNNISITSKLMAISAIIGWSGISVHAQIASITSDTDINIMPFICARAIHGILAALYTIPISIYMADPHYPAATWEILPKMSELGMLDIWKLTISYFSLIIILLLILIIITILANSLFNRLFKIKSFWIRN